MCGLQAIFSYRKIEKNAQIARVEELSGKILRSVARNTFYVWCRVQFREFLRCLGQLDWPQAAVTRTPHGRGRTTDFGSWWNDVVQVTSSVPCLVSLMLAAHTVIVMS